MTNPKPNTPAEELTASERFDYERLKQLEIRRLENYRELKDSPALTPERTVAFINQLSPWNLKTTGLSALEAYCNERVREAQAKMLNIPNESKFRVRCPYCSGDFELRTTFTVNQTQSIKEAK